MRNKHIVKLIETYQKNRTDEMHYRCRHRPTCSEYAIEAIDRYGSIKGTTMAIKRIIRCNPFGKYGYDPVPKRSK